MKTIRNKKTGEIQRVDNKMADNMVGISQLQQRSKCQMFPKRK